MTVIPEWVVRVGAPDAYDRHTAITAHCHHGNHGRCGAPHRTFGGNHTVIIARDGYPAQFKGGPLASVHLAADECVGCHCECHSAGQLTLDGVA